MKLACRGAIYGLPETIGHRILLPDGSITVPSLSFTSNPNSGFFISGTRINFINNGDVKGVVYDYGIIGGGVATGAAMLYTEIATDVIPGHNFLNDADTGIGRAAADQLSLIAKAVEQARLGVAGSFLTLYDFYTDVDNYEGYKIDAGITTADTLTIAAITLGTGADNLSIALTPSGTGYQILNAQVNGQAVNIKTNTTLLTIAAGGVTSTWASGIPANTIVIGISSRVTVAIPADATNYDVGIGGATTRYTTNASGALNTTSPGTDDGLRTYTTATNVVITTDANPATNVGRIRLTVHYLDITPPTS